MPNTINEKKLLHKKSGKKYKNNFMKKMYAKKILILHKKKIFF